MAFSLGRRLATVAKNEVTYGTAPAFSQTADSLLMYENHNPIQIDAKMVTLAPLRNSYTSVKSIVGRQLYKFSGQTMLQGAENLGAGTPWRFGPILRACGLTQTINGVSSIVYTPRSNTFESVAMQLWLDGYSHVMSGAFGTFQFEANAGEGMRVTFDMQGLYNAPSVAVIPAQTLETAKAVAFVGAAASIAGQGVVLKGARFNAGVVISERDDANASDGLAGLYPTDRSPTLELDVEVNKDFRNYWTDLDAGTTQIVMFTMGTASGNRMVFQAPEAQISNMQYGEKNGFRIFTLSYLLQSAADDGEYSLTFN